MTRSEFHNVVMVGFVAALFIACGQPAAQRVSLTVEQCGALAGWVGAGADAVTIRLQSGLSDETRIAREDLVAAWEVLDGMNLPPDLESALPTAFGQAAYIDANGRPAEVLVEAVALVGDYAVLDCGVEPANFLTMFPFWEPVSA